jgi:hypothetical protein
MLVERNKTGLRFLNLGNILCQARGYGRRYGVIAEIAKPSFEVSQFVVNRLTSRRHLCSQETIFASKIVGNFLKCRRKRDADFGMSRIHFLKERLLRKMIGRPHGS